MSEKKQQKDHWTEDGAFFICDGVKYGLAPDGRTVCAGPVEKAGDTPSGNRDIVLQQASKGNVLAQGSDSGVMQQKHAGGRPKKEGAVHRVTEWRREKQAVMAL